MHQDEEELSEINGAVGNGKTLFCTRGFNSLTVIMQAKNSVVARDVSSENLEVLRDKKKPKHHMVAATATARPSA